MNNLLHHQNVLKFENVYVYSKSLGQPKYSYLERLLRSIRGIGYYAFSASENILPPTDVNRNSVVIVDDMNCDNQHVVWEYVSMSRYNHIDSFYLI